jgi:hypothetical protein
MDNNMVPYDQLELNRYYSIGKGRTGLLVSKTSNTARFEDITGNTARSVSISRDLYESMRRGPAHTPKQMSGGRRKKSKKLSRRRKSRKNTRRR